MNTMKHLLPCAFLFLVAPVLHAQHAHLNVGAAGVSQGDPLVWANGDEFAEHSGYIKTLVPASEGRFAGYYEGNITLTALPATPAHAGPDPDAAALGSFIQFRITCHEAPPGGSFGFWDSDSVEPAISLSSGEGSTNLWRLTESDGSAASDPYGHIHGRRFTATKPGIYRIGFTAVDTSVNGAEGGPIHAPSDEITILFQAGINLASIARTGAVSILSVGVPAGWTYSLESAEDPRSDAWEVAFGPLMGDDHLRTFEHAVSDAARRFYRVAAQPPVE